MDITINIDNEDSFSIVHVTGKVDATTSDSFEIELMKLLDQGETQIIFDLENTRYISSAGLRVLIVVAKKLYGTGYFCLCNANNNVQEVIKMSGLDAFMHIHDDIETAKKNLKIK